MTPAKPERTRDPFLLSPGLEHSKEELERSQDPRLPRYDKDVDAWVGPFFMGPINTRVVRRSIALFEQWQASYGPNFTYQEYMKFEGPFGWMQAAGLTTGAALFKVALQSPIRHLLNRSCRNRALGLQRKP